MNGTFIQKFLVVFKQKKILGNICFSEQIFHRKQSLGGPEDLNQWTTTIILVSWNALPFRYCASSFKTLKTAFENSRYFATPLLVSPPNDV